MQSCVTNKKDDMKFYSIYDVIAKLIVCVLDTNEEYDIISGYVCNYEKTFSKEFIEFENQCEIKSDNILESVKDFSWVIYYIDIFYEQKRYFELLSVLEALESYFIEESIRWSQDISSNLLVPLNEYLQNKILIFPKMNNQNEWSHSVDELSFTINSLLSSLIAIDVSLLHDFKLVNHYINLNYFKGGFWVGGSPITDTTKLSVNKSNIDNVNYMLFQVEYEDEQKFINNIIKMIEYADEQQVSLLAFPELISNYEINREIESKLESCIFTNLKLIAFPSYYDAESHSNIGSVYYTEEKRMIFEQQKTFSFISGNHNEIRNKEYLNQNKEIHVLHIQGVGRIFFPICKDMLVDKYMDVCKAVRANLIVTRSYSPGVRNYICFYRTIMGYTSFDCNGFWLNSCNYNLSNEYDKENRVIALTCDSKHMLNENESYLHKCPQSCERCLVKFCAN